MKSLLYSALLLLSLSLSECDYDYYCSYQYAESYYECQKYELQSEYKYCCFHDLYFETKSGYEYRRYCMPLSETNYKYIDEIMDKERYQIERDYDAKILRFEVNCGQSPIPSSDATDSPSDYNPSDKTDSPGPDTSDIPTPDPEPTPEPSSTGGCIGALAKSYGECKDLEISSGYEQCCYFHSEYETDYKKVEDNFCNQVTKSQYYDLQSTSDSLKKSLESQGYKVNKFTIDCGDVVYHCGDKPGKSYTDCKSLKVSDSTSQCCHIHEKYDYLYHDIEIDRCAELTNIDYADKNGYLNVSGINDQYETIIKYQVNKDNIIDALKMFESSLPPIEDIEIESSYVIQTKELNIKNKEYKGIISTSLSNNKYVAYTCRLDDKNLVAYPHQLYNESGLYVDEMKANFKDNKYLYDLYHYIIYKK